MPFLTYDPNAPQQSGLGGLNMGGFDPSVFVRQNQLNSAAALQQAAQQAALREQAAYEQAAAYGAQSQQQLAAMMQLGLQMGEYRAAQQQQQQQQATPPGTVYYNPGTGQFFRNGMVVDEDDDAGFLALAEAPVSEGVEYRAPDDQNWMALFPEEVNERLQGIKNPSFGKLMGKNWDIGVSNMKMLTGALMSWAGMEEAGGKVMAAAHREVEKNQPYSKEFTGVLEGRDSLLDWFAATVAQQGPNIASTILSAAAGAAAGSAVAPGAGTIAGGVTGFLGRGAASKAALRLAKQFATKENQKLLVKAAAKYRNGKALDAAEAEIFKKAAMGTAAAASATAANYGMALGDTYNEMIEHGTENRALAAATGIPYAMLDLLPQALAASKILGFGKALAGGLPTRVGKGVVAGMGIEGLTEGSQKVLTLAAAQQNPFTPENLAQIANEAAAGAAVGGLFGAASGVRSASTKQTDINDPGQPADLLNGNPAPVVDSPAPADAAAQPALDSATFTAIRRQQDQDYVRSLIASYQQGKLSREAMAHIASMSYGWVKPYQVEADPMGYLYDVAKRVGVPWPQTPQPAPTIVQEAPQQPQPQQQQNLLDALDQLRQMREADAQRYAQQFPQQAVVPTQQAAMPAQQVPPQVPQQMAAPTQQVVAPMQQPAQATEYDTNVRLAELVTASLAAMPPVRRAEVLSSGGTFDAHIRKLAEENGLVNNTLSGADSLEAARRWFGHNTLERTNATAPAAETNPALTLALGAPAPVENVAENEPAQPKRTRRSRRASSKPTGAANLQSTGTRRRKATSGKQAELFTEEGLPTMTAAASAGVREQKSGDDTAGMTVAENEELANQQATAPFSGVVDANAQEATGEQNAGEKKTTRQRAPRAPKAAAVARTGQQKAAEKKTSEKKTTQPKQRKASQKPATEETTAAAPAPVVEEKPAPPKTSQERIAALDELKLGKATKKALAAMYTALEGDDVKAINNADTELRTLKLRSESAKKLVGDAIDEGIARVDEIVRKRAEDTRAAKKAKEENERKAVGAEGAAPVAVLENENTTGTPDKDAVRGDATAERDRKNLYSEIHRAATGYADSVPKAFAEEDAWQRADDIADIINGGVDRYKTTEIAAKALNRLREALVVATAYLDKHSSTAGKLRQDKASKALRDYRTAGLDYFVALRNRYEALNKEAREAAREAREAERLARLDDWWEEDSRKAAREAGRTTRRHVKSTEAAEKGAALWSGISPERRSAEADLRNISVAADPENKQLYHAMDVDPEGAGMFWHTEKETVERGEAVWNALDDKQKEVVKAQMARTLHKKEEDVAENDAMFWHIGKLISDSAKPAKTKGKGKGKGKGANVIDRAIMLAKVREKFDVEARGFDLNEITDAFLAGVNDAANDTETALDNAYEADQMLRKLIKEKVAEWFPTGTLTKSGKENAAGLLGELNKYADEVYESLDAVAQSEKPARDIVREVWSKTELGKEAARVAEARAKRAAELAKQREEEKAAASQETKQSNADKRKRITEYITNKRDATTKQGSWLKFVGWAQAQAQGPKPKLTQADADVISAVAKRDKNRPLNSELDTVLKAIALREGTTEQKADTAPGEQRLKAAARRVHRLSDEERELRKRGTRIATSDETEISRRAAASLARMEENEEYGLEEARRMRAERQQAEAAKDTAAQYEDAAKKPSAEQSSSARNESAQAQEAAPTQEEAFAKANEYTESVHNTTISPVENLSADKKLLVEAFKTAFGVDLYFFETSGNTYIGGLQHKALPRVIFVNNKSGHGAVRAAGHELLHLLRANRPFLYKWFINAAGKYIRGADKWRDGINNRYLSLGLSPLPEDVTTEELVANYIGDLMADKDFMQQLAKKNPSKFAQFAQTLIDVWDRLVAAIKKALGDNPTGVSVKMVVPPLGADKYIDDLQETRALVAEMLDKFATGERNDGEVDEIMSALKAAVGRNTDDNARLLVDNPDADLATRATIAGALNMRYPEGGSGVLGASDLLRMAAGKATNLSGAVSRALNHLQTTNQKALRSEGFAKVYSLIDEMHTFGRSLLSKYHRMMHRTYSPNLFGFKDGVSEAQKERAGELLSHAALQRAGTVDDEVLVEQTAPLLEVDERGDWRINQTVLNDLKKRGYVTAEEFRKGLEITRSDGSTFIFKRNVDEKSNEWAVYNEARQAINEGAVDLLMATVGAAQAEVDTRFTELLNGIAGDTTAHRATMERVHEMLAKLIRSNETVTDGRVYLDDVTSETVEDTIITLGRALFNEGVLYALEDNAKAPQEIHEEVNAKTWLRSRDEYKEIVKGLRSLYDKLNKGARKTKDGKIDTEKARQWSYQWQAALRDLQLQDQNVRNAELYAKQTILSSYVPFSRWGNEQVGLKAIDVATGKPVRLPDAVRGTLPYFLAEDEAMALDVAEKLNEAFDGEFEIDGRMVRLTAEVSRAKQTRDYTSGASLADVLNFMRRMGVNPAPQQRKRLVEALTAQGSAARHGLKRIGVPGWDKNVVRGVSEHLETVSHLAAKKRFDPQFSATLGNDSLWLGDDDKLANLQRIVDEAETEETRAQAQRDYDAYAYKYLHMKAIGEDNKVTIGGEERATLGVGEDYREEAKRLVSWVQGTANIAESTEDILSGDFGSKLKLATVLMQLGGSIATAVVNLSSVVTHAMPYLSYYNKNRGFGGGYGVGKAVNALWKAANDVKNYKLADPYFLEQVLKKGEWGKYGMTAEEARFLFEQTEQGALQAAQFNALIGTARGKVQSNNMQAAIQAWMAAFSYTEQFNRRVTALAAFRLEQERLKDAGHVSEEHIFNRAAEAAKKAVVESQGEYAMWNRPEMARGNIMQYVFMYKQFVITTIQLMKNMPKQGQLTMLAMLFLCSGLKGLPFADDLMDIIDTICQALGLKVASVEAEATKLLDQMAPGITPYVMRGVLDQWTGATFSTRLGQGDLIPLSGAFKAGADPAREAMNFAGPVFSGISGLAGLGAAAVRSGAEAVGLRDDTSDFGEALRKSPIAGVRALADAAAYAKTGDVTNSRGQVIAKGASPLTVAARAAGFYPASATRQNDLTRLMKQQSNYAREISDAYKQAYVKAMKDGDRKRMVEIEQDVRAWNRAAKGTGLEVGTNFKLAARRALKEANKPLGQRTLAAQGKHQRKAAEQLVNALDG